MTTLYKLTDSQGYTRNNTHWHKGITYTIAEDDRGIELCSHCVIHAYTNPNLALLLNPIHANFDKPRLYEAEGEIKVQDWGKVGVWELFVTKRLELPNWYKKNKQKVQIQFAVLCAEAVLRFYEDKYTNDERPRKAIQAAKKYLKKPSKAAADAAYAAAYAAARGARAAAYAARAIRATRAAADAADAAANAADAVRAVDAAEIDFTTLADKAVELIERKP